MLSRTTTVLLSLLACPVRPLLSQETTQPVHVSGGIMAGRILTKGQPVYPPIAPGSHVSGATVLRAIIGKDGHVQSLSVISGPEALRAPAIEAVKQWTYQPYRLNGKPVDVETTITITVDFGGAD